MNRDNNFHRVARAVSARASARFAYLTETIARSFEPTPRQLEDLERAYNATGEYLVECKEFGGRIAQVHAQGSRQMGTIVRPMDAKREGFDIDLVVRMERGAFAEYGGPGGASLLLDRLHTVLKRCADRYGLGIQRWERCITLTYAGGMQADFAPVIEDPSFTLLHGEHHGRIPDRELRSFLSTNPKGYCLGFDEAARVRPVFLQTEALTANFADARKADVEPLPDADEVFGRLLSRFVQLGKVHRNIAFADVPNGKDLAPSSVFLTSLFSKAYALLAPQPHDGPLDLFFDIVELLPHLFVREPLQAGGERWTLMNPYAHSDNLASSMNTVARQRAFLQWQEKLVADMEELQAAVDGNQGMDVVTRAVEKAFGPRASQIVLQRNAQRREADRTLQKAGFVVAGTTPIVTPARAHTFFGGKSA